MTAPAAPTEALDRSAVRRDTELLRGDLRHLLNPVVGQLRLAIADPERAALAVSDLAHIADRLSLALALADEAATGRRINPDWRGRHGVGDNHYPLLAGRLGK